MAVVFRLCIHIGGQQGMAITDSNKQSKGLGGGGGGVGGGGGRIFLSKNEKGEKSNRNKMEEA